MEEFVSDTLHSVLASTYHQIEVIVVDDGSTDASPRIVAEISARDARVKLLHQENAGPSRARNRAVAASNGVYILPVDADNLLAPQFIAQAVPILKAHPEVKVVRPTMEFIGDKQGRWQLPEFSLPLLARRNHIDTCALYRRAGLAPAGGVFFPPPPLFPPLPPLLPPPWSPGLPRLPPPPWSPPLLPPPLLPGLPPPWSPPLLPPPLLPGLPPP